jgi:hypothetical protein
LRALPRLDAMAKKKFETVVVGMGYRVTTSTLRAISTDAPLKIKLEREPDNEHDENAIKVLIVEKPYARHDEGFHIGYIPHAVALVLAPIMDTTGLPWDEAWITSADPETGMGELLLKRKSLQDG